MNVPDTGNRVDLLIDEHAARVSLVGEFDLANSAEVDLSVGKALALPEVDEIVIDLRECSFLSSTGLHSLVSCNRLAAERDCVLTVVGARGIVRRSMEICGLHDVLSIND
jgi:anti-anti-sigma factor